MKIEMGESLIRSWLRHCKHCQLAELNWKPSLHWSRDNREHAWHKKAFEHFGTKIFKKNKDLNQVVKQAEIDVLGIYLEKSSIQHIYAFDVAFHSSGLGYKNDIETKHTVMKKLLRSAITLDYYIPDIPASIIFASPRVYKSTQELLELGCREVVKFVSEYTDRFNFCIYTNTCFENMILTPLIKNKNTIADTSELFLRSIQLYNLYIKKDNLSTT